MKNSTVHIDGQLYFWNAVLGAVMLALSQEEAYKYVNPIVLFWAKLLIGSFTTGINALKAFRSMTFGRKVQEEQKKQDEKNPPTPPVTPAP